MAKSSKYSREGIRQRIGDKRLALGLSVKSAIRFTLHNTHCRVHLGIGADEHTHEYFQVSSGGFWLPVSLDEMVEHIHRFMY